MKNFKILFIILMVVFLAACGGNKDFSNERFKSDRDTTVTKDSLSEVPVGPNDLTLENKWIAETRDEMSKLFVSMNMTAKQVNRFEVEFRNSSNLWRKENPDEVRTIDERRAMRDKLMYNILNHDQMDQYLLWTQEIKDKK